MVKLISQWAKDLKHSWRRIRKKKERKLQKQFNHQFKKYSSELGDGRFSCNKEDQWPCLYDATGNSGFDAHYLYHPAWAMRIIAGNMPVKHIDISSVLHFSTLLSSFLPVDFYDYRPAEITLSNLQCRSIDLINLPFDDNSIGSLSCMHVVEHVGIGRYGDPFDAQGDRKAMRELQRVLSVGGVLLFVVPIGGKARIQFNAHRIYTFEMIINEFPLLKLENFALITDSGSFINESSKSDSDAQEYGCGCFYFTK